MPPTTDETRYKHFQKVLQDSAMVPSNKKRIEEFLSHAAGVRNVSIGRQKTLLDDLISWDGIIKKPFDSCTRKDIERAVASLNSFKMKSGEKYAGWTKRTKLFVLKSFFKYLNGGEDFPDSVKWIGNEVTSFEVPELVAADLLTKEDITQLLSVCNGENEAAIIYVLWETGVRASEFTDMKIGDLKDMGLYWNITVRTRKRKAGSKIPKTRTVPIVESRKYLDAYLNKHPMRSDKAAPLWLSGSLNRKNKPLTTEGLGWIVQHKAKQAGIKKRVWVHLFRHSRASILAPKLPPVVLNRQMGWATSSRMWNIYLHLTDEQCNDEVLKLYGLVPPEKGKPTPIEMKKCPNCKVENIISNVVCSGCGRAMDTIAAINFEKQFARMQARLEKLEGTRRERVKTYKRGK